ncbi:MAG: PAS domain-containing protein [Pseudoxanthomonas sp.]
MRDSRFPAGNSAMADKVRAHDWSATVLGPFEQWPGALRAAVNLMLNSPESMYLVWGDALTFLYNDTYTPILGPRADKALGAPLKELWADAWDAVRGPIEAALRGEPQSFADVPIEMNRYGQPEQTWWTFSFTPVYLDDGHVGGALCITNEVTDKRMLQDRLAREHERLARLFSQAPMFMAFLSGPEHLIEFANPGYLRLVGDRELVGKTVAEALPDAVAQGYLALLDQVYASGQPYAANNAAYIVQASPDVPAQERYVDFVYQPITNAQGAVSGVFVQGVDVTNRARAEVAVRELDARNRQIMDSATDYAIIATDVQGLVTHWNEGARLILGWEESEMLGKTTACIFTPEDALGDRARVEMESALLTGRGIDERWHLRKSGERFWANGSMTVLRDADGEGIGFVKVLRDRTEERLAEAALRSSEQRLAALVTASSEALYSMDAHWTEMRELAGDGFLRGQPGPTELWLEEYVHQDDRPAVLAAIRQAVDTGKPLTLEHRVHRPDGRAGWSLSRAVPLLDQMGVVSGWFGAASDITARRAAEEELRELTESLEERVRQRTAELLLAEEKLRQSQKMEAVGQLTGGLAHDFNNLLTAVTMGLEMLQMRLAAGSYDRLDRYVEMAMSGASRAAALTQRLLAFSRRQTLAPTTVRVDGLVEDMEQLIRRTLGPAIDVRLSFDGPLWHVLVDAPQLENALLNLCINARDAMPHGGTLTIEAKNGSVAASDPDRHDLEPGDYVQLCVRDTGAGISPELMDKVFEPFFTTKPIGQGTGLGLSMIYGFVRQSGGQVRMESTVGQGTRVCLYLPRFLGAAAEQGTTSQPQHALAQLPPRTVLLVEDETAIRVLMSEILGGAGYRVIELSDGIGAVARLQSAEAIDLLVTDVGLTGGLNGRQVADAGRQCRPGLPVLFVTGYAANAAVGAGQLEQGMQVLTKPFKASDLERHVHGLLAGTQDRCDRS